MATIYWYTEYDGGMFGSPYSYLRFYVDSTLSTIRKIVAPILGRFLTTNVKNVVSGSLGSLTTFYMYETTGVLSTISFSGTTEQTVTSSSFPTLLATYTTSSSPFSFNQTLMGSVWVYFNGKVVSPVGGYTYGFDFKFYKVDGSGTETFLFTISGGVSTIKSSRPRTAIGTASGTVTSSDKIRVKIYSYERIPT